MMSQRRLTFSASQYMNEVPSSIIATRPWLSRV